LAVAATVGVFNSSEADVAERGGSRVHERWARLRFSVIGQLLASPPAKGALRAALKQLAAREWRHPSTGAPVRFGVSTIERWFSAEQIVLRSGSALGQTIAGQIPLFAPHNNIDYSSALSSAMS
jgi:hypothetical protein